MVAEPILGILNEVKTTTPQLLKPALEEIRNLQMANAGTKIVSMRVKQLIADFNEVFERLRDTVSVSIGSWPDGKCNDALRETLENLEDRVKQEMERLAMDTDRPAVRPTLAKCVADFHTVIMDHDPGREKES